LPTLIPTNTPRATLLPLGAFVVLTWRALLVHRNTGRRSLTANFAGWATERVGRIGGVLAAHPRVTRRHTRPYAVHNPAALAAVRTIGIVAATSGHALIVTRRIRAADVSRCANGRDANVVRFSASGETGLGFRLAIPIVAALGRWVDAEVVVRAAPAAFRIEQAADSRIARRTPWTTDWSQCRAHGDLLAGLI
jgi:hypothetical protein